MISGTCRGFPCDQVRKVPCPPRAIGVDRRGRCSPEWGCVAGAGQGEVVPGKVKEHDL